MPAPSVQLAPAFQRQDQKFARAFDVLREAIGAKAFPGASVAVTIDGSLVAWRGLGRFTYDNESPSVSPTTVYDLASVTKVVATTMMAMMLFERGRLKLETQVVELCPEFASIDARRAKITLRHLLTHSSGLPGYERYFTSCATREELLRAVMATPLAAEPGTVAEYSDPGFILLGELLAKIAGEPLDRFCEREIFEPLGMAAARFTPPPEWATQIPPTENDEIFRRRIIQGEVNDENCSVMGGVGGHAGLFGSALCVATFGHCLVNGGGPLVSAETVEMFTRRESAPIGTSRALGWDTPSQPSSSGTMLGARAFGHLGFTGTSLWCDPDRKLSVTLLTNRTWPDRSSKGIQLVRPRFHDAIVEALEI